jgi:hypothetical protein
MEYPKATVPGSDDSYYWGSNNLKEYGGRNNYRMPAYHRMDIGLNFHKQKKRGIRTWSVSVYNAYCHQNPFMLFWDIKYGKEVYNQTTGEYVQTTENKTVLKQFSLYPIIPSISYSFKF